MKEKNLRKANLVTINQGLALKELGFHECVLHSTLQREGYKIFDAIGAHRPLDANRISNKNENCHYYGWSGISIPTVDEAIDWLRRKFNVIIYNFAPPFVDPRINKIVYSYAVKSCNTNWGWNLREIIGQSSWSKNPDAAKRQAITLALRWIKDRKKLRNAKVVNM